MASAAGFAASPGIVMIDPVFTTTNPAPADGVTSRTVIRKPRGRPSSAGLSENEYWVLAMQTGASASPKDSSRSSSAVTPGWKSTPSAP